MFQTILSFEPLGPQGPQLPQTRLGNPVAPLADRLARDAQQLGQRHGAASFFNCLMCFHVRMVSQLSLFCNTLKNIL